MLKFRYRCIRLFGIQSREEYKMRHLNDLQKKAIEDAVREILIALGEDADREGLIETPKRVAKMYDEVFEGIRYTNDEIAEMFNKCFNESKAEDLVCMSNIDAFSFCEHHIALMYNLKVSVAYIPRGRVIGLSKIARIVDMVTKRLQLQERIGEDIAYILEQILGTDNVMIVISGEHSCMTARGIKKPGTVTHTAVLHGMFRDSQALRAEVYSMIGGK